MFAVLFGMRQAGIFQPAPTSESPAATPSTNFAEPAGTSPAPAAPLANAPLRPAPPQPTAAELPPLAAFRQWLADYLQAPPQQQKDALEAGLALAQARRPVMAQLIRSNPEAAIQQALHLNEWEALPAGLRAEVEKPFSEAVNYKLFPVCPGPGSSSNDSPTARQALIEVQFASGEVVQGFVYGGKNAVNSKQGLPTQGIALDGVAALRDGVFQPLSAAEAAFATAKFPAGQPDPKRSWVTGEPIGRRQALHFR